MADDGPLLYQAWPVAAGRELVWVDREGREESIAAPPMIYIYPRLSPDGLRVALDLNYGGERDAWTFDLRRGTLERFTDNPTGNPIVAWSPDGRYLAFGSDRYGVTHVFRQLADGSGEPERLLASTDTQMPITYAPDGRLLLSAAVPGQQRDIYLLSLDGQHRSVPLIATAANELTAEVSHDGRELFYRDFDGAVMSVAVTLTPTFAPGPVTKLFQGPEYAGAGAGGSGRTYDVALDDSRFIMLKERPVTATSAGSGLVVVLNWFAEPERLAPLIG